MSEERKVLAQDLPQYQESLRVGGTAKAKQIEQENTEIERENKEAEEKYQKELAEYNKSQSQQKQSEILQKEFNEKIAKIEEEKAKALVEKRERLKSQGLSRKQIESALNKTEYDYNRKINKLESEARSVIGSAQFAEAYPGRVMTKNVRDTFLAQKSSNIINVQEKFDTSKQAQYERQKTLSVQQAQREAREGQMVMSQLGTIQGSFGLSIGAERAERVMVKNQTQKNTPLGRMAEDGRARLINVDTGQSIMGWQKESEAVQVTTTENRFQVETPTGVKNFRTKETAERYAERQGIISPIRQKQVQVTRTVPGTPESSGVSPKTNPVALLAGMFRQDVDAAGKPIEPKTMFSFENIIDVKEESGRTLLEFQSQLKTRTAPSATVYKGILEERGLPLTPLSKRIIDVFSSKGIFRNYEEPVAAKGRKAIISKEGKQVFDLETGMGDVNIGRKLGFVYDYNLQKPTTEYPKMFEGSLEYVISPKVQGPPKPRYETVVAVPGNLEYAIKQSQPDKLSSSGERLEFGLKLLEREQKKYAKYNDEAGQLLHVGFGIGKDILAGAAFVENLAWEGEALVRGGPRKTRDIIIPRTGLGDVTEEIIAGRPQTIYPKILEYEREYGKGTFAGEIFSTAIPLPGAKLRTPFVMTNTAVKIWQKSRLPELGRLATEKVGVFELNKKTRITKQIAESRADEGVYGIKRVGKNTFLIERGLEEQRSKIKIERTQPSLVGFSKEGKPIFTKVPKKEKIPTPGKVSEYPLTVVKFEKGKTTVTDFGPTKDIPVPPKRIVISSPDVEFVRQQKSLGATEISKGVFEIVNPKRKTLIRIQEMIKAGYMSNIATGRTASLKLVKKDIVKEKARPRTVKEMLEQSKQKIIKIKPTFTIGRGTAKKDSTILGERQPTTVKQMRKLERQLQKQKREEIIFDVIERPEVTQVYETLGGLGKAKFVKDVTKTKDIIPFGSKDLERKLESVGLGEKRKIQPTITPYNYSQIKSNIGTGGSVGKAKTLSESTKEKIIGSYSPKIKTEKPIDYLQVRSGYKPRSETTPIISNNVAEYVTLRYPEEIPNKLMLNVKPLEMKSISRLELRTLTDVSQSSSTMQLMGQRTELDTSQVTKQKEETLQKQKYRLDTTLRVRRAIRMKQLPHVRLLDATIPITVQSAAQPQQLKQPQKTQLKQKQVQLLRYTYPRVPDEPVPRKRRFIPLMPKEDEVPKSVKKKSMEKADFLGNVSEVQVEGIFGKRSETVYGQKKISKLLKGDIRVVEGKKRTVRVSKKKFDLMGFKKGKSKDKTSFW